MKTFEELNLLSQIQRALVEEKYVTPTPIQAETIPPALLGRDILGCAQTGTGKTAAFALPILNRLGKKPRKSKPHQPQALILAPTRELAVQIGDSLTTYGRHLQLRQVLIYGGVSAFKQVRKLKRGVHILIATPGRLLDLMNQGHISLESLQVFVLDEADRMLDMGFLPDLKRIIAQLPEQRQSLFFSATLSPNIIELTESLLQDPVSVNVTPEDSNIEKIQQKMYHLERKGKVSLLRKILSGSDVERALVFSKTKRGTDFLVDKLDSAGIRAVSIHGDKTQRARQRALNAFREDRVQVLVATDVAARGIDIDGISHVINYDLPMEPENYVHRIGRTGRAGAEGIAISFCTPMERGLLGSIERLIDLEIPCDPEFPAPQKKQASSGPRKRPRRKGKGRSATAGKSDAPKRRFKPKPANGKSAAAKRRKRKKATGEKKA